MLTDSFPALKYVFNPQHRNKRLYERWGNYKTYLADPRELLWKMRAKREARSLMEDSELRNIQREAEARFTRTTYGKYLNFERYLAINLRRVYRIGLDRARPQRILDIGSGCGFFSWLCARYGHDVRGLDIPGIPIFDHLIPEFHIPRTEFRIAPGTPLPDFGRRFNLVVSFAICFHELEDNRRWDRKDWHFFLNDMKTRIVEPGGRLYLFFNNWPPGDFEKVCANVFPCPYTVKRSHKILDFTF